MKKILIASCLLMTLVAAACLPACKATRTISSTATYTEVTDSSKVTTTISTKTVEDYLGVQKK